MIKTVYPQIYRSCCPNEDGEIDPDHLYVIFSEALTLFLQQDLFSATN
jgi:hypothetical protein